MLNQDYVYPKNEKVWTNSIINIRNDVKQFKLWELTWIQFMKACHTVSPRPLHKLLDRCNDSSIRVIREVSCLEMRWRINFEQNSIQTALCRPFSHFHSGLQKLSL